MASKSSKPAKASASKASKPRAAAKTPAVSKAKTVKAKGADPVPRITDNRLNDLSALNSVARGMAHQADDEKRYPSDLGMRWFYQGSHLPAESHQTESDEDDVPAGRLRLTRTAPGGWGKPQ